MNLNAQQQALHSKAMDRARKYKESEWQVIEVLREVEQSGLQNVLGCSTLFTYAVKYLDLDNALAYAMIRAARISQQIPRLEESLKTQKLTVTKAARIFSTLNSQNANELISFAERNPTDQINREIARIRKSEGLPAKWRKVEVSDETYTLIKRARSLSQKDDIDQTLKRIVNEYLDRHDPVRRAKRSRDRRTAITKTKPYADTDKNPVTEQVRQEQFCTYKKRKPLTADEKHQVFARDGGQCTQRDAQGRRCTNDRYLHIHHIRAVSRGGTNDPANLTILCSFHHDLAHQLTLPLEGQITWLRSPRVAYG